MNHAIRFVLFLAMVILGAAALVHYLTPCEGAALCSMAAFTPTRLPLVDQIRRAIRAWHLRLHISSAEEEAIYMHAELAKLPERIASHKAWIEARRVELIDCTQRPYRART